MAFYLVTIIRLGESHMVYALQEAQGSHQEGCDDEPTKPTHVK